MPKTQLEIKEENKKININHSDVTQIIHATLSSSKSDINQEKSSQDSEQIIQADLQKSNGNFPDWSKISELVREIYPKHNLMMPKLKAAIDTQHVVFYSNNTPDQKCSLSQNKDGVLSLETENVSTSEFVATFKALIEKKQESQPNEKIKVNIPNMSHGFKGLLKTNHDELNSLKGLKNVTFEYTGNGWFKESLKQKISEINNTIKAEDKPAGVDFNAPSSKIQEPDPIFQNQLKASPQKTKDDLGCDLH